MKTGVFQKQRKRRSLNSSRLMIVTLRISTAMIMFYSVFIQTDVTVFAICHLSAIAILIWEELVETREDSANISVTNVSVKNGYEKNEGEREAKRAVSAIAGNWRKDA